MEEVPIFAQTVRPSGEKTRRRRPAVSRQQRRVERKVLLEGCPYGKTPLYLYTSAIRSMATM